MIENIGNRHAGDLGGRLAARDAVRPVRVRVAVAECHASHHATQHTACMLINLLARLVQVVGEVIIDCPGNAALLPNVIPGKMMGASSLRDELLDTASGIGGVTIRSTGQADRTLLVSPEAGGPDALQVFGTGWRMGRGRPLGLRHYFGTWISPSGRSARSWPPLPRMFAFRRTLGPLFLLHDQGVERDAEAKV